MLDEVKLSKRGFLKLVGTFGAGVMVGGALTNAGEIARGVGGAAYALELAYRKRVKQEELGTGSVHGGEVDRLVNNLEKYDLIPGSEEKERVLDELFELGGEYLNSDKAMSVQYSGGEQGRVGIERVVVVDESEKVKIVGQMTLQRGWMSPVGPRGDFLRITRFDLKTGEVSGARYIDKPSDGLFDSFKQVNPGIGDIWESGGYVGYYNFGDGQGLEIDDLRRMTDGLWMGKVNDELTEKGIGYLIKTWGATKIFPDVPYYEPETPPSIKGSQA